jgi:hypothetical protein
VFDSKIGSVGAVEHEKCEQCGFDGGIYDDAALLAGIRDLGPQWRDQLAAAGDELRLRPAPQTWSALEYAAHTRDVLRLHVFGVEQAVTGTEPHFPEIASDLVDDAATGYADEDRDEVTDALDRAARQLADVADEAGVVAWTNGITIGTNRSDVRRLLEHARHDAFHHLDDVDRGLRELRSL